MIEALTPREAEILTLIAEGLTNSQIAARLVLSLGTVKVHTHNIYGKLGVTSRVQAVLAAEQHGLVPTSLNRQKFRDQAQPLRNESLPTIHGYLTPLVGRESDLVRLGELIDDPRVRLITILGPGGMGKTRLAVELMHRTQDRFPDGVFFISLANASNVSSAGATILDSIGVRGKRVDDVTAGLVNHLSDRRALLVLDSFEYVLPAADVLADLIHSAPEVTIVCTSRERLNLSAEVVWTLGGLDTGQAQSAPIGDSGAAQLLISHAQAAIPDFALGVTDGEAVRQICQLTGGMPLAIILAAGWLNVLSLSEVAAELTRGLDILSSTLRDLPERQRSMRATLALSWDRLDDESQSVLKRLAVFVGGAAREAAQRVSGASIFQFKALADRSFLTVANERVDMHEVVRQFALDQLRADDPEYRSAMERHAQYFAQFLDARAAGIYADPDTVHLIKQDFPNIRSAWSWAVQRHAVDLLVKMSVPMATYWHIQGNYEEGLHTFHSALVVIAGFEPSIERDRLLACLQADLGWLDIRVGKLDDADRYFRASCDALDRVGEPLHALVTSPRIGPIFVRLVRAQYSDAREMAMRLVRDEVFADDAFNSACVHYTLASAEAAMGQFASARSHAELAVSQTNESGDRWFRAYCLVELAQIARVMGDLERSVEYANASLVIREEFGDPEGMAVALQQLAAAALHRVDLDEAYRLYARCETLYEDIQDEGGYAAVLHGLARVALGRDQADVCVDLLLRSIGIARRIGYAPLLFETLVTGGELLGSEAVITFAVNHPGSSYETRMRATARGRTTPQHGEMLNQRRIAAGQHVRLQREIEDVIGALSSGSQPDQHNISSQ